MTKLPDIQLDDRRFQDLVSEARLRINRSCPEWTEHNVSDPGITLIELFAWMTEMTIYRLNRVPDKLHVTLLELLGIQLDGPSAAATDLRFRLVEPPTEPLLIQGGATEVGTPRTARDDAVVFQVRDDFTIPMARPAAYVLQRGGQVKDVGVADAEAHPQGADQMPFGNPPAVGDALYIGFDEPIGRLLMQVDVDASPARGAGVNPEDPPLRWEVSQGDNGWEEAVVLEDLTGGFNYGAGTVELQLPPQSAVHPLGGHRMHWLRCRIDDKTRHGGAATTYTQAPEIYSLTAAPIGALLPAQHAALEENEVLGVSDGTPGQTFPLRFNPVLKPATGETLEVQDPESGDWAAWELRADFVTSTEFDRHFILNPVAGEVELGPAIRETDGGWTQYGADPAEGRAHALHPLPPRRRAPRQCRRRLADDAALDARRRRHGDQPAAGQRRRRPGGPRPRPPARGDGDPHPLPRGDGGGLRVPGRRGVAARRARGLRGAAGHGGPVALHMVPRLYPADRQLTFQELQPSQELLQEVSEYLDDRRLIGTTVQLLPCSYRGLSVIVNLQASPLADTARVEEDVAHALYTYINPLVGGNATGPGQGWDFGRALNQGELYGVVHAVDGVEFVKILRIYETNLQTGEQSSKPAGSHIVLEPDELLASAQHIVKATHREA